MTYAFVVGHTLFTLSCSFISICMLMSYIYNFSLFSHFCTFVREYYFGLQIDFCRGYTPFYIPPAYLDKIYITIICYLSFLPNNEK